MSMINERALEFTGPGADESIRPLGAIDHGGSGGASALAADDTKAAQWLRGNTGKAVERRALLSLLMGYLADVPIADVVALTGLPDKSLVSMMHGKEPITRRVEDQLVLLVQIFENLHHVLKRSATSRWLHTSIPALSGATPLEALRHGFTDAVLAVSRSYLDSSYR